MIISINNVAESTAIFLGLFIIAVILSIRKKTSTNFFSTAITAELKGLAILMVVFSHISYFLVTDNRFLYPLGTMAGVGVNLFLLLSGFGLAVSAMLKPLRPGQFYLKRLLKLYTPLWLFLAIIFLADYFFLNLHYGSGYILRSFFGLFPRADLYTDVNSPLWYFGFTVLYYLAFPLIFWRKFPWLSAILLYLGGYWFINASPSYFSEVLRLYEVHIIAFPLGVFIGSYWSEIKLLKIRNHLRSVIADSIYKLLLILIFGVLSSAFYYAWLNPGIGVSPQSEQYMSIVATLALLGIFILKPFDIKLFYFFGLYSFEVYLWHWPLLYRYDYVYKILPAWLATILYLILFLVIGFIFRTILAKIEFIISEIKRKNAAVA
ncbi:MAG: acyltransferase [bacterium]